MELSDELWQEIGYVSCSKYRTKVMKTLEGETKIPTKIAEETGILKNHISNTLRQLREHGLIVCINPEAKKGRLYRLTDKGEEVTKNINLD